MCCDSGYSAVKFELLSPVLKLMFFSPLKFSATWAFVFLVWAASGTVVVFAQPQNRDSLRLEVPRVTLSASPSSVVAGRQVRLVAQLSSGYPNIRFRFDFGDGTQSAWQSSTVITHTYRTPGNYLPFVDIGVVTGGGVTRLGGSPRRPIQVTHAPLGPVQLFITPATPETGGPVTFRARIASNDPNVRYRFDFGDGSPIGGWQSGSEKVHVYTAAGRYAPYVEVTLLTNRGLQQEWSSGRAIVVTDATPKNRRPEAGAGTGLPKAGVSSSASTTSTIAATRLPPKTSDSTKSPPPKGSGSTQSRESTPPTLTSSPSLSPRPDSTDDSAAVVSTEGANDWRKYMWLALPLALLAFIAGKRFLAPAPVIRTHADAGTASVSSDEGGLVKKVRREDV